MQRRPLCIASVVNVELVMIKVVVVTVALRELSQEFPVGKLVLLDLRVLLRRLVDGDA
jgi:hypothetical protein